MASGIRYFVGNWKMFGISSSYKILDNVNKFFKRDKKNKKKYKIINSNLDKKVNKLLIINELEKLL